MSKTPSQSRTRRHAAAASATASTTSNSGVRPSTGTRDETDYDVVAAPFAGAGSRSATSDLELLRQMATSRESAIQVGDSGGEVFTEIGDYTPGKHTFEFIQITDDMSAAEVARLLGPAPVHNKQSMANEWKNFDDSKVSIGSE